MKKTLIYLGLILSMALTSCGPSSPARIKAEKLIAEERKKQENRELVEEITNKMIFFKEKRTGICFVYLWDGHANGGPALTIVPEEAVKDFLIEY